MNILKRVGLFSLLVVLMSSFVPTHGQAPALGTPRVLSSFPALREVIGPDTTLQIVFDQPMNRASVEASLVFEPKVEGVVAWQDDATLTFDPAGPLQRGAFYTVLIAASAQSAAGVELGERFELTFQVKPNLSVNQVIPAPDSTEIDAAGAITVIFDRPVVPLVTTGEQSGLPQPLILEPAVEGVGEWIGTAIYRFRPKTAFAGGTTYTATIRGDVIDVDGAPMASAYLWKFATAAPRIVSINPVFGQTQVPIDAVITVTFNQPMDESSTRAAFSLRNFTNGSDVAGALTFNAEKTGFTFKPSAPLALQSIYQAALRATAQSASGQAVVSNPQTASFTTLPYPAVVSTYPTAGQTIEPYGGSVSVQFNTLMDEKSFAGKVRVSPEPKTLQIYGGQYLQINFPLLPATAYTITVDAGVKDIYGNAIDAPFSFTFNTTDARPQFAFATKDRISVISAYQPKTELKAATINVIKVNVDVAAIDPQTLLRLASPYDSQPLVNYVPAAYIQQVTFPIPVEKNVRAEFPISLVGAGNKLAPGAYFVRMQANIPDTAPTSHLVVVSSAALVTKLSPSQLLVWVTDLKTGQPLANTPIAIYDDRTNQQIATITTDAKGIGTYDFPTTVASEQVGYVVVVNTSTAYGFTTTRWGDANVYEFGVSGDNPTRTNVYLYSDQPIYRPGRPVYFRGVVRQQTDNTYQIPPLTSVDVRVNNAQGQEIFKADLPVNSFGTFNGKFDLAADAPLGGYTIVVNNLSDPRPYAYVYNNTLSFAVAEFRPPEFLVTSTAAAAEYAAGDTIKTTIDAKFLFGGAVSGATVAWTVTANQGFFNYTGQGNYDFGSYGGYWYGNYVYQRPVAAGTGKLDDKGQLQLEFPADLGDQRITQNFTIEATVTDISNQSISGRTQVTVHPAAFYIGLQPTKYVGRAGEALDVNLIAVDWASVPVADKALTVSVFERRWEQDPNTLSWEAKRLPVKTDTISTGGDGRAVYSFVPPNGGIYEIEATTRDARERIASTTITLWVQGENSVSWGGEDKKLTLIADAKAYKPGDTANVLITSPFPEPVTALITVERAGVMASEVITFSSSYTYPLKLDDTHAPNVFLAVTLLRASGEAGLINEARFGLLNLQVAAQKRLTVKLTADRTSAEPGKTVKFDVLVTDPKGEPTAAEVGLALSDVATLSVGSPNSTPIFDFYWSTRGLSVVTAHNLTRLIDGLTYKDIPLYVPAQTEAVAFAGQPAPIGGASERSAVPPASAVADGIVAKNGEDKNNRSDQAQVAAPRSNFVDTPLWQPSLITGADGRGSVDVVLPDNLTTWRLSARAVSTETLVGDGTIEVISTKPLLVRPATPRFFIIGDETELSMVVNNNSDRDLDVQVKLEAKGVTLRADAEQTVKIPKAGRTRVTWLATVNNVPAVDLIFSAVSGDLNDASKPAVGLGADRLLPVYNYVAPDYVSTAGALTSVGTRTEAVVLPSEQLAPTGEITIKLSTSLAATTLDGLAYLENYPYQCIEQTVSKFLPNVITFRALQKLNLTDEKLKAQLQTAVSYAVARLQREQKPDGGWGWFPRDESNPLTTSYALLGLIEARESDLQVDQDMIFRAITYLQTQMITATDQSQSWVLNRQVFLHYVLTRAGNPNRGLIDALFGQREKLHLYARAYLAQIYGRLGDQEKVNTLLSDLNNAAIVSATGTHWEEGTRDWWNWDSNTRTTAIVLEALVELSPQSQLIPNIVRWLMVARRGDAWETTQETAWAVMALTNWMEVSGELKADYGYTVSVNDKPITSGKASAETLRETVTLQVQVADLLRGQANRVTFDHQAGDGTLYYTATLHVNQPVESIKPTDRGLAFTRTYTVNNKPVLGAKVGDVITVALEIVASSDLYYVNIEDPIPAGTEIIDRSLQTTAQAGQRPELSNIDPYYGGWGWWWFSNTEARTEKMVLSATYLPRGSYRFVYQIQATTPGTYRVIPPNGQEFYFPEVFGRGAGSVFTVTGE